MLDGSNVAVCVLCTACTVCDEWSVELTSCTPSSDRLCIRTYMQIHTPLYAAQAAASFSFYRAKLRVARYCHGMLSVSLSVCLSVRPSVTLRYRDHIRSNSAKIISRLLSLTISLSADPNITNLLQREHPQILAGIAVG